MIDEIHTASCWCVARRAALVLIALAIIAVLFGAVDLPPARG